MEGLLTLFVGLTAIAVITQAVVLIAIYLHAKRLGEQVQRFMRESREVLVPVKAIAANMKTASANLVEIGVSAREQFHRVETIVTETGDAMHVQIERLDQTSRDVATRINETAAVVQDSFVKPFREAGAIAKGVSRGLEAFFKRNRHTVDKAHQDEELFI